MCRRVKAARGCYKPLLLLSPPPGLQGREIEVCGENAEKSI